MGRSQEQRVEKWEASSKHGASRVRGLDAEQREGKSHKWLSSLKWLFEAGTVS
jgi:hypothetical protein